ncbi:hypothetical protein [Paraburkholderia sp. GAS38]|uniref:hypothetical protein n=1 Tax=Paraburkholderia sp. GAS38 TaxID=3035133 RepID=UPI003D2082AA
MFRINEFPKGSRFLIEALPLVATYFSGATVDIAASEVLLGEDSDAEAQRFASQVRLRHALACCQELIALVHSIEQRPSSLSRVVRSETRGAIRGRLDIPRYVARRPFALSWPKTYPILIAEEAWSTPENALTQRVFRYLLPRLSDVGLPSKSAEVALAREAKVWINGKLRGEPWRRVVTSSPVHRLRMETARRLARRQTGNDRAYKKLIELVDNWHLAGPQAAGSTSSKKFVEALLAFPADESFLDRIYEIWCVREIAACLSQAGAQLIEGPAEMSKSRSHPIYTFHLDKDRIEIWFQRALPTEAATWRYDISGRLLRGIPDITIIANAKHYLLVDAKNRLVTGNTRSEETYKMLGYFENFRSLLATPNTIGVLAFVSHNKFHQALKDQMGRRLAMISADPDNAETCQFNAQFSEILTTWLSQWRSETT